MWGAAGLSKAGTHLCAKRKIIRHKREARSSSIPPWLLTVTKAVRLYLQKYCDCESTKRDKANVAGAVMGAEGGEFVEGIAGEEFTMAMTASGSGAGEGGQQQQQVLLTYPPQQQQF